MNTASAKQKEAGQKDETREIPNAFARTPQAKDDLFTMGQIETNETIAITENTGNTFVLDVMANDKGGRGRELWSLDDGISEGDDAPKDLLNQTGSSEVSSAMGARISITSDGKVAYTLPPSCRLSCNLYQRASSQPILLPMLFALGMASSAGRRRP